MRTLPPCPNCNRHCAASILETCPSGEDISFIGGPSEICRLLSMRARRPACRAHETAGGPRGAALDLLAKLDADEEALR